MLPGKRFGKAGHHFDADFSFGWLSKKRCWTADKLAKRGLPHPNACSLCDQEEETIQHLLVGCAFSRQLWFYIFQALKLTELVSNIAEPSFPKWWRKVVKLVPKERRQGLNSLTILTTWEIWKHRNSCVFENT
jgi:hypothetical protein